MSSIDRRTTTETPSGQAWVARHPLVSFVALAYGISWSLWLVAAVGGGTVAFLAGGFGPLVAAWIVLRLTGGSVREWLGRLLRWRVHPGYYAYALLLPVAVYAVIDAVLSALGQPVDAGLLVERLPQYLPTLLFVAVLGGGLEEPGWRGFALPRLQGRFSPVVATLVLGLVWGVWHVPIYGPLGFVVPAVLAFFYTWLYNRTRSVLLCVLLHASFTPAQDLLLLMTEEQIHPGGMLGTADFVTLGVYVAGAALLTLITRGRLGEPRH